MAAVILPLNQTFDSTLTQNRDSEPFLAVFGASHTFVLKVLPRIRSPSFVSASFSPGSVTG